MTSTKDKFYPITREQKEIAYQILADEGFYPTPMDVHQDEFGNLFVYVVDQDSDGAVNKGKRYLIDIR